MAFDTNKFQCTKFSERTEDVPVPDLQQFFKGDAVWKVRGLSGEEMAIVDESEARAKNMLATTAALVGAEQKEKISAMRELLGVSEKTPLTLLRRIDTLLLGSVEPKIDRQLAVKLADCYPMEFKLLVLTILTLAGKGKVPGKLPCSGETPKSEQQHTCASSGEDSSMK